MSTDRRYSEQEVAFILERASNAEAASAEAPMEESPALPTTRTATGLTLTQLTEIAGEVGLSAASITEAARAVDRGDLAPTARQTMLGLPVGVARTISIDRPVSDAEWERMVVLFRQTFNTRGTTGRDGSLRHWSVGNLHAMLEPTATGHQLRLQTRKGDVPATLGVGAAASALGLFSTYALLAKDVIPVGAWIGPGILLGAGVVLLSRTVFGLGPWARTRAAQMEQLATDVTKILDESDAAQRLKSGNGTSS